MNGWFPLHSEKTTMGMNGGFKVWNCFLTRLMRDLLKNTDVMTALILASLLKVIVLKNNYYMVIITNYLT